MMCGKSPMGGEILFKELSFSIDNSFIGNKMIEQIKARIAESEKRLQEAIDRGELFVWSPIDRLKPQKPLNINDFRER